MSALTVNIDRPALEISRGGVVTRWEYDVLTLKIEMDRLAAIHGRGTTAPALKEFSEFLVSEGLEGCTLDLALRVHSLVTVQFSQLAASIAKQVAGLI